MHCCAEFEDLYRSVRSSPISRRQGGRRSERRQVQGLVSTKSRYRPLTNLDELGHPNKPHGLDELGPGNLTGPGMWRQESDEHDQPVLRLMSSYHQT